MDTTEDELKMQAQCALPEAIERWGLFPDAIFQHWKGGLYVILSVSVMQETWEILVTYKSNKYGTQWTHTLDDFTKQVTVPNIPGQTPRFCRTFK